MRIDMQFHNYRQAVLATLAFFDVFDHPLTTDEIEQYLLQLAPDRHAVEVTLKETQVLHHQGLYHALRPIEPLIQQREERKNTGEQLWKRVHRFQSVFSLMPYIRGVSVCNTLAYDNAKEGSDIDVLVIMDPRRMFLGRLFLTMALQLWGVRRHGKKIAGRFCLSFFITADQLNLESIQKGPYDIYLAYWLRTLKPLIGPQELHEKLVLANQPWSAQFFAQPFTPDFKHWRQAPRWIRALQTVKEWPLNGRLGDWLEEKLAHWQLERARKKQTSLGLSSKDSAIVLNRHMLKFHNLDQRAALYEEWKKRLGSL